MKHIFCRTYRAKKKQNSEEKNGKSSKTMLPHLESLVDILLPQEGVVTEELKEVLTLVSVVSHQPVDVLHQLLHLLIDRDVVLVCTLLRKYQYNHCNYIILHNRRIYLYWVGGLNLWRFVASLWLNRKVSEPLYEILINCEIFGVILVNSILAFWSIYILICLHIIKYK